MLQLDRVGLPESSMLTPTDGMSIRPLFSSEIGPRSKPIPFRRMEQAAWIDNDYKLLTLNHTRDRYHLYHLGDDPEESIDLFDDKPEVAERMVKAFTNWNESVQKSFTEGDYPEPFDPANNPKHGKWSETEQYAPYVEQFNEQRTKSIEAHQN